MNFELPPTPPDKPKKPKGLREKVTAYATAMAVGLGAVGYGINKLSPEEKSVEPKTKVTAVEKTSITAELEEIDRKMKAEGETNDQAYKRHMFTASELPDFSFETGNLERHRYHLREAKRIVSELPTDTEEARAYKKEREQALKTLDSIQGVVEELEAEKM